MSSDYDASEFVDGDYVARKGSHLPASAEPGHRAPTQEEVDSRVTDAQNRLAELRMKQSVFCRLTGFDQGLLSKIQSSMISNLTLETSLRLAVGLSVPPEEILEAVAQVHRGGAPMSSHIARLVVTAFRQTPPSDTDDSGLTPREEDILRLLAKGHRSKEIADELCIGTGTVNTHVRHIYEKLHAKDRQEAISKARKKGLI